MELTGIDSTRVQHFGFGLAGSEQHEAAEFVVDFDHAIRRAGGVLGEDRFHRLDGGDDLAVGRQVVVGKLAGGCEALRRARRRGRRIRRWRLRGRSAPAPRCRSRAATARPTAPGTCRCSDG